MRKVALGAVAASALLFCESAHAGTVSLNDGVALFTAGPGEANDLTMRWPRTSLDVNVTDAGAPLTVGGPGPSGEACSPTPVGATCTAWSATALLGDRDDRALVSVNSNAEVWGGPGNDTIGARGEAGSAIVYGGPGNDIVSADGEGGLADGGPGDDVVSAFWNVPVVRGGPGDDELHFTSSIAQDATVDGGPGSDRIVVLSVGWPGSVTGGAGNDSVVIQAAPGHPTRGSAWSVDTGPGDDTIQAGPGMDVIDAGAGADQIDVAGGKADTVTCGAGRDTVHADVDDVIAGDCEVVVVDEVRAIRPDTRPDPGPRRATLEEFAGSL